MRGKKCIKFLTFFITLVLSFVLFSNDTSAVDYTSDIRFVGQQNATNFQGFWRRSDSSSLTESLALPLNVPKVILPDSASVDRYVDYFVSNGRLKVNKDNLYELKITVRIPGSSEYPLQLINSTPQSSEIDGVTWSIVNVKLDILDNGTVSGSQTVTPSGSGSVPIYIPTDIYPHQIAIYSFLLKPNNNSDSARIQLSRAGQHLFTFTHMTTGMNMQSSNYELPQVQLSPSNIINEYSLKTADDEMNEKDDEDRSNLESQSSDTDSASESSSQDAENTGTTLLGAFSAFVTALTSASPSNCNLDMDLGNLDLGVVNLCQLSPPQPIPTIASIFLILFCVPLSIATARKVINLFRSFQ